MKNLKKILAMVDKFAQLANSAQSGDVEQALKNAGLFDIAPQVSPLLDAAKIPADAKVHIDIVVDKMLNPHYSVTLNPPGPSAHALANLVKKQYSVAMKKAFTNAKLNVADTVATKWLSF